MSLNDRLRSLEKQQESRPPEGLILFMPYNERDSNWLPKEKVRADFETYLRTGKPAGGGPLVMVLPEHRALLDARKQSQLPTGLPTSADTPETP